MGFLSPERVPPFKSERTPTAQDQRYAAATSLTTNRHLFLKYGHVAEICKILSSQLLTRKSGFPELPSEGLWRRTLTRQHCGYALSLCLSWSYLQSVVVVTEQSADTFIIKVNMTLSVNHQAVNAVSEWNVYRLLNLIVPWIIRRCWSVLSVLTVSFTAGAKHLLSVQTSHCHNAHLHHVLLWFECLRRVHGMWIRSCIWERDRHEGSNRLYATLRVRERANGNSSQIIVWTNLKRTLQALGNCG